MIIFIINPEIVGIPENVTQKNIEGFSFWTGIGNIRALHVTIISREHVFYYNKTCLLFY